MFCNKDVNDAVSFDLLISPLFQVARFPVPAALKANFLGKGTFPPDGAGVSVAFLCFWLILMIDSRYLSCIFGGLPIQLVEHELLIDGVFTPQQRF